MKPARWLAVVSGLALVVTLALPVLTNGRASFEEVRPAAGGLFSIFVVSCLLAMRVGRAVLLALSLGTAAAALVITLLALDSFDRAGRARDELAKDLAALESFRQEATKSDGYLDPVEADYLKEHSQYPLKDADERDAASHEGTAWAAIAAPLWAGIALLVLRRRKIPKSSAVAAQGSVGIL